MNSEYLKDLDKISTVERMITCDAVERAKCHQVESDFGIPKDYLVVSTDYTTYSIVYTCSQEAATD